MSWEESWLNVFKAQKRKKKKEKKISSGRVQALGSSFRDPWDSFVVRPLTYSLKSYPRELIKSNSLSSQHCPFFVLCGLFVTEWTQNHAVFCLQKENASQVTSEFHIHPESDAFFIFHTSFHFPLEIRTSNGWPLHRSVFPAEIVSFQAAFSHENPSRPLMTPPPIHTHKDADRWSWKKQSSVCLKTKKFQDFYLVLSTFQMLSNVVDFRDGLLFFQIGNQASFSLKCTNNSWNLCWDFLTPLSPTASPFGLSTPSLSVVLSAFGPPGLSHGFWLFFTKEG